MDATGMTGGPDARRDRLVHRTKTMLRDGVPLTLLLDLADPAGPDSARHFASEPADLAWLLPRHDPA